MRRHSSPHLPGRSQQRGYALLLMLVMVTMGILFTIVSQLSLVGTKVARAQNASAALVQAKEALIGYAITYRDDPSHSDDVFGYLPCPDMNGDGSADALSSDCGGADGKAVIGLLPYKQLGLASNQDADGNCLWYAVSGTFKASGNPNLPGPMNWDTQGQIEVRDANNNIITTPNDTNGGAAAVIFSVGPPLSSQSRLAITSANPCGVSSSSAKANAVYANYIDVDLSGTDPVKSQPFPSAQNATVRVTQGTAGNAANNDQILAITPKEIFSRIIARADFKNPLMGTPAGLINDLTNKIKINIETQIQNYLVATGTPPAVAQPANQSGYSQSTTPPRLIGDLPTLTLNSTSDNNWQSNWSDQYRYILCSDLTAPCLSIADSQTGVSTDCRGALLFSGQSTSGGPRPSTQKPPTMLPPPPNTYLVNYFESGLGILTASSTTFTGNTSYMDATNLVTNRSADIGTCLFPGAFVSFAKNIADFAAGTTNSGSSTNPLAQVNSSNIQEGSSGGNAGSGCVWDINPLQFTKSLRLYFRINFAAKGNGFTVALADGATNLAPDDSARSLGQIMCGAADSGGLGYAGAPPSGSSAGVKSPKVGIEFDTNFDGNQSVIDRHDPHTDHAAFLFWGNATDNGPSGNGADDTTHYIGTGGIAITNAAWASGAVSLSTSAPHGLAAGQTVLISGITPRAYNGTYTVSTTGLTTTQFQVSLASNPGTFVSAGMVKPITAGIAPRNPRVATAIRQFSISKASYPGAVASAPQVVIRTQIPHNIISGDTVYIYGVDDPLYDGIQTVQACKCVVPPCASNSRRFCYAPSTPPSVGPYFSGTVAQGTEISSISWSNNAATAKSPDPLPFHSGALNLTATIFGATPSVFDTTPLTIYPLTSPTFSYSVPAPSSPGSFSTENPAGMFLLKSSTSTPHNYFNYSSIPTNTSFHVRLDVTRSYDSTNHVAVLNLKAYIGDTFPSAENCTSSNFQNMTDDLATLCPSRKVTLQQDSIPVNAIARFSSVALSSTSPPITLVTVTTTAPHRLVNGAKITISGVNPATYNGTYTVAVGSNPSQFTYSLNNNPGPWNSGGDIQPLTTFYLGFTNSRGSSSPAEDQSVTIDQLLLRSQ